MTGDAMDYETLSGTMIIEKVIKLDQIVAEKELIPIKPKYFDASRSGKLANSKSLKNFSLPQVYTINLCKINCRITRALKFCHCAPFFYAVKHLKTCDIKGMLCLTKTDWYNATGCECPSLCETTIMTKMSTKNVSH
jgi:Amiloride-sensitive sodium channel